MTFADDFDVRTARSRNVFCEVQVAWKKRPSPQMALVQFLRHLNVKAPTEGQCKYIRYYREYPGFSENKMRTLCMIGLLVPLEPVLLLDRPAVNDHSAKCLSIRVFKC